jgi:hypothetical protein
MAFVRLRRWLTVIRNWPTDRVITGSAVFVAAGSMVIALCSLSLSITEARAARRHDRLSVRPRLSISFDYNDKGTGWTIINQGLGPARIRGFRISVNGVRQPPTEYFPEVFKDLNLPPPPKDGLIFANIYAGDYIPNGSGDWYSKKLLIVSRGEAADALRASERRTSWQICYCSIFDECWLLKDRDTNRDDACSTFINDPHSIWWMG